MEDFTAGAIQNQPSRRIATLGPEWDARVRQLVEEWGADKNPELIEEMIITALKMARDKMGVADLKLINRSLKELRYAAKVFAPYSRVRKVVVFGSARVAPEAAEAKVAEDFAREMVAHNYMVITGGGDGIMGAAQRGAGREHSFGLNIRLPFEQRANEIIEGDPKLINFNYFFTRKLNFVKETHAFALFPGGFGTMDEAFEVLTLMQTGKARVIPVVLLDQPEGTYWETWMKFLGLIICKVRLRLPARFLPFSKSCRASRKRSPRFCSSTKFIIRSAGSAKNLSFASASACRQVRLSILTEHSRTSCATARSCRAARCVRKRTNRKSGTCRD